MPFSMYKKIIDLKKEQNCTLEQLASKIGVNITTIKNWKTNEALTSNIIAVSKTLNISVDALLQLDFIEEENVNSSEKIALLKRIKNLDLTEKQFEQLLYILQKVINTDNRRLI